MSLLIDHAGNQEAATILLLLHTSPSPIMPTVACSCWYTSHLRARLHNCDGPISYHTALNILCAAQCFLHRVPHARNGGKEVVTECLICQEPVGPHQHCGCNSHDHMQSVNDRWSLCCICISFLRCWGRFAWWTGLPSHVLNHL